MRLEENPLLPRDPNSSYSQDLNFTLSRLFRAIASKVNGMADGRLTVIDNALTAAPTTGTWAQGDFVRNSAPAEAGAAASKYVIYGWICSVGGTPGTWLQCRFLTGN
jgi:hypothetical protein